MRGAFSRTGLRRERGRSDLQGLADEDLMALVRDGDALAFEVVYDRHCDAAFSLAYRMCGRRATAEDVLQDAFLALWRGSSNYERARGSLRNWILRIVHNRAVDALRRATVRERDLHHEEGILERQPSPEDTEQRVLLRARRREVEGLLEALPREQSRLIELAYFGGFTHTEIARMLQLPVGTVKGRIRLGLAKLRVTLAEEGTAL